MIEKKDQVCITGRKRTSLCHSEREKLSFYRKKREMNKFLSQEENSGEVCATRRDKKMCLGCKIRLDLIILKQITELSEVTIIPDQYMVLSMAMLNGAHLARLIYLITYENSQKAL